MAKRKTPTVAGEVVGEPRPKRRSKRVEVDEAALAALGVTTAPRPDLLDASPPATPAAHRERWVAHYQAVRGLSAAEARAMYRETFGH